MAGRRDYIHELQAKLQFLARRGESGTWAELERYIPRSTRQNACNPNHQYHGLLGRKDQEALAAAFGFEVTWEEWLDPLRVDRGPGRGIDTADAFKKRLFDKTLLCGGADVLAAPPEVHAFAKGMSGRSSSETAIGRRRNTFTPLGLMAQVALDLGQPAGVDAYQVLVEISCHASNICDSDSRFSVRNAVINIQCGDARGRREAITGITRSPVVLENASGNTSFMWCGSVDTLRWEMAAGSSTIGYHWFDAGVVENILKGKVLRIFLSAWLKHIEPAEAVAEVGLSAIDTSSETSPVPSETLSVEQQRLIEHVTKLRLSLDGNGYAEIASSELEIVGVT